MERFVEHTGIVAPLDRANVDTDQIMPKQFLKRVERTGFGEFLFFDWRYHEDGTVCPGFELNAPGYRGASILATGRNFGGGSSREHAPWGLLDYGFRALIAPSFADIFYSNCLKNGILPICLPDETVAWMIAKAKRNPGWRLTVDLPAQRISDEDGFVAEFEIDPFRKHCLLNGLDDIGLTLQHADRIGEFESHRPAWLVGVGQGGQGVQAFARAVERPE